jgi:hypothetical protein
MSTVGLSLNTIKSNSPLWLLLLILILYPAWLHAQGYKKLFTNSASASLFQSVVPQGKNNSMVMAVVNDSIDKKQGIRISRLAADGSILASAYYNLPDYPDSWLYPSKRNACRIHDNLFVFAGGRTTTTCGQEGFILTADSNGVVQKFVPLTPVSCGSLDCFMYLAHVQYDSVQKQILLLGHTKCSTSVNYYLPYLLKYDTSLNLIWSKTYPSFVYPNNGRCNLILEKDHYILCGMAYNGYDPSDKRFDTKSLMLQVDTAGNMGWMYYSPLTELRGAVVSAINTSDGGYIYCTMGQGYNRRDASLPTADFYGKPMLVKLDAARNEQWVKVFNKTYSPYSPLPNLEVLNFDDSTFYFRGYTSDSIEPNYNETRNILCKYKIDGTELWRRYLTTVDPDDTLVGQLFSMEQMHDKAIVIVGMTSNDALSPSQRGFGIRVDSNGCLSPDDPQCNPTSIPVLPDKVFGFKVSPNPSNGNITIIKSGNESGQLKGTVYDMLGRIIFQKSIHFLNNQAQIKIDAPQGNYIIELKDESGTTNRQRILIQ